MTGEEMERAIEFLLQGQANFDARLEQTNQQVAETSRQLQAYAETQSEFIQIVTRHIEAQAAINASLRESIRKLTVSQSELTAAHRELTASQSELTAAQHELTASQSELTASQRELTAAHRELTTSQLRTDERLDRLAATVERFITEGRNGNSQQ